MVIEAIKDHFDQPGCAIYHNLEELLVKDKSLVMRRSRFVNYYHEIDGSQLNVQLESLTTYFRSENIPVSLE